MAIILEENRFGPLTNWRMARHHSVENGGPVTPDEVGSAAMNLERYIVGHGLSPAMVLHADEAESLRTDVDGWDYRRAVEMALVDVVYCDHDDYADDSYDYDDSVIRSDWARESRYFW